MKKLFFLLLGWLGGHTLLFGQQATSINQTQYLDSVYIDAKVPLDRKKSGKAVTVISRKTIEQNPGKSVAQLLDQVVGFEMNGAQGNNGQNLGYFVRGGRNRQVLVLVDGVPLNDASQISNDYDLRLLTSDAIERIEVLKGASGVLYGSGAATAVISITTRQELKDPFRLKASSLIGTDRSAEDAHYNVEALQNSMSVGGALSHIYYDASISHRYSDGLSAIASPVDISVYESDTFNAFNSRFNIGIKLNEDIRFSQFVTFDRVKNGFDDFSYTDANYESISEQFRTGGNFTWSYGKGAVIFNDNFTILEREIASNFPAKYDTKVYSFDTYWQHQWSSQLRSVAGLNSNFSEMNSFTIPYGGIEFNQDIDATSANYNYYDPYLNFVYNSRFGLSLNAGARLNLHSIYDSHLVYQINPSYYRDFNAYGVKFLASYSTAYITPSLFQLFDPIYGNAFLEPEENVTWEGGLEVSHREGYRISILYFKREENNFIDFVVVDPELFVYQYQNVVDTFNVQGLEVEFDYPISAKMNFRGNYTFTERDDRFALRIPKHKANGFLDYYFNGEIFLGIQFQYVSEREDVFFNSITYENESVFLSPYSLFHLNANAQITKNLNLSMGVQNILNQNFEELYRYQTRGRNVQLGLHLSI